MPVPAKGKVARYILTCAQNNTKLHPQVWANLEALAAYYRASILVSRFMYETRFHGKTAKPDTANHDEEVWYDEKITPHVCDESVRLAPGLVFSGELQILPTARRPISGLESYTGRDSCIVPHTKFAMQSIASGKSEAAKLIYTTGTVTKRNYVQKKAGLVAQFHHGYGAVLVEVDHRGSWWVRQLNADSTGTIYDLTMVARQGKVYESGPTSTVEAIVWGDCHVRRGDKTVAKLAWGEGGMLDTLKPRVQFFHDLIDFRSRNHHEIDNSRERFKRYIAGGAEDSVRDEVFEAASALWGRSRPWCKSVVVASNHDAALQRWLDTADYREDPKNAQFFLRLQHASYEAMAAGHEFDPFVAAMRMGHVTATERAHFLKEDESYVICKDAGGGIECGMHGHLGPNGLRGSPAALARMGRKAIVGHSHSAGIHDGVYVAGTSSDLDLGYNRGPSSWTHSHVIVYKNGKRSLITMWKGKWRA